jgi:hypothetical protein
MYRLLLLSVILSFIVNSLICYVFDIVKVTEQLFMYLIILSIIGGIIYLQFKDDKSNIDKFIQKIIVYSLLFFVIIFIFRIFKYFYEYRFNNINSMLLLGLLVLVVFICFNIYKINSIYDME